MEALVFCRCTHSMVAHEDGGCAEPHCDCRKSRYRVIDEEIDSLKDEHGSTFRATESKRPA
jgi:hypothetical protein